MTTSNTNPACGTTHDQIEEGCTRTIARPNPATTSSHVCRDAIGSADSHYDGSWAGEMTATTGSENWNVRHHPGTKPHDGLRTTSTAETLYYDGYRYYSGELGRWTRRDPIGEVGGLNLYVHAFNSPVNYIDPLGEVALIDTLVAAAVGGAIGAVSAAFTGGDPLAGFVGGATAGACMSVCPAAITQCAALGGGVSGFVSGLRSAHKKDLCGAKWMVHVAASTAVGTATGAIFGKAGEGFSPYLGAWTKTMTAGELNINITVTGADWTAGFSGGVATKAAELVVIEAPEAALFKGEKIIKVLTEKLEKASGDATLSGEFK